VGGVFIGEATSPARRLEPRTNLNHLSAQPNRIEVARHSQNSSMKLISSQAIFVFIFSTFFVKPSSNKLQKIWFCSNFALSCSLIFEGEAAATEAKGRSLLPDIFLICPINEAHFSWAMFRSISQLYYSWFKSWPLEVICHAKTISIILSCVKKHNQLNGV